MFSRSGLQKSRQLVGGSQINFFYIPLLLYNTSISGIIDFFAAHIYIRLLWYFVNLLLHVKWCCTWFQASIEVGIFNWLIIAHGFKDLILIVLTLQEHRFCTKDNPVTLLIVPLLLVMSDNPQCWRSFRLVPLWKHSSGASFQLDDGQYEIEKEKEEMQEQGRGRW